MNRPPLKRRVLLLTAGFAVVLFAVTFGLTWRAQTSQQRWTRLIDVELRSVATLDELIRTQSSFTLRGYADARAPLKYRNVEQLLDRPVLEGIDIAELRSRVGGFRRRLEARPPDARLLAVAGRGVVTEAQRLADERKQEVARQIPRLQRETRDTRRTGLATAWIIFLLSLAAVITMMKNVVAPMERLVAVAKEIGGGNPDARATPSGDLEIWQLGEALNEMAAELNRRARTDDLTSLPNFRSLRERLDGEIERSARYKARFGILVLDLDRFKKYNDTYGHLAGNAALQRVAGVLKEMVREKIDMAARYGGEEFVVILTQADLAALQHVGERIRASVEALAAPAGGAPVTISIGAALYPDDGVTAEELFHAADERLYEAKRRGRNLVVVRAAAPDARSAG